MLRFFRQGITHFMISYQNSVHVYAGLLSENMERPLKDRKILKVYY